MSAVAQGTRELSLVDAVNAAQIGAAAFICYSGNGGGFLSEFIAYLGVWYQDLHADPLAPELDPPRSGRA